MNYGIRTNCFDEYIVLSIISWRTSRLRPIVPPFFIRLPCERAQRWRRRSGICDNKFVALRSDRYPLHSLAVIALCDRQLGFPDQHSHHEPLALTMSAAFYMLIAAAQRGGHPGGRNELAQDIVGIAFPSFCKPCSCARRADVGCGAIEFQRKPYKSGGFRKK
jgi:hypothetical protein